MVPVLLLLAWTAVGAGLVFAVLGWITVAMVVLAATQSAHDGVTDRADIRPRVLCSSAPWSSS
jgi:hypothetical protein